MDLVTKAATEVAKPTGNVATLAANDETIYAGGTFDVINGESRAGLAALDGDGALTSWSPSVGLEVGKNVKAIEVAGGNVFVAGEFTTPRLYLAAFEESSGILNTWNPHPTGGGVATAVNTVVADATELFVGGYFSAISGQTRTSIANYSVSNLAVSGFDVAVSGTIEQIALTPDKVFLSGGFNQVASVNRVYLAAVNRSAKTLAGWNPQPQYKPSKLLYDGSNKVFIAGSYENIDSDTSKAFLTAYSTVDYSYLATAVPVLDGYVGQLVMGGNHLYAAGGMQHADGVAVPFLIEIDENGDLTSWRSVEVNNLFTLSVVSSTRLFIGGGFDKIGAQLRKNGGYVDRVTGAAR